jgi:Domain of unknown function (DU1801)
MAKIKTKATGESVAGYFAKIENDQRREDCEALARLLKKITRQQAKMWGPSMVGFGKYHYKYESGHEGDMCIAGFSSRKPDLTIYLFPVFPEKETLLKKLGKHKTGKSCLYIRKLEDVDTGVLEKLIAGSIAEVRRRYPS